MTRTAFSRPVATALADGIISEGTSVFDYGCGRGGDVDRLHHLGYQATGWDPVHRPQVAKAPADIVNLGYVVNVIEDPRERRTALAEAWGLSSRALVVAGRTIGEDRAPAGVVHGDGLLTARRTFQKLFTHAELGGWIADVLGVRPHAAAPGVFYVFRDDEDALSFLRSRVPVYRPRVRIDPHHEFDAHRDVIQPLLDFMTSHGRSPRSDELTEEHREDLRVAVGGVARAARIIRAVTDDSFWEEVIMHRRNELLVMLALGRFRGVNLRSDPTTRLDARQLFGSEDVAHGEAYRLLLACSDPAVRYVNALASPVGRLSGTSIYVHTSALAQLPPVLRVFDGCARLLAGTSVGVNIVRLSFVRAEVEYRVYDDFDRYAHPQLLSSSTVAIGDLDVRWARFLDPRTRPVLHRKEEFVAPDYPRHALFAALSRAEDRHGLYDNPSAIRTAGAWEEQLRARGLKISGHRIGAAPNDVGSRR
ncbi:DNA phosphorothioation-associated putative methyltransferase [Microbacterium invictum]|uniref:DNA phosphorothioation-associated putative methyltransferase n=2 Tax=Microbacterium invictum TaxID=515415 RepID=A0AA40VN43_9MICO|nr:DNA phosphorothioation-associated putative methyltransferase [Microbacterium invictum]